MSEYKLAITFQVSFKAVLLWGVIVQTQGMKVVKTQEEIITFESVN